MCIGVWDGQEERGHGRPKCSLVNTTEMYIVEIGLGGLDCIGLAQDRYKSRYLMNSVMNLRVPQNAGKLSSGCTTGGLLSSAQLHRVGQSVSWLFKAPSL
jgi:hypothetical protein